MQSPTNHRLLCVKSYDQCVAHASSDVTTESITQTSFARTHTSHICLYISSSRQFNCNMQRCYTLECISLRDRLEFAYNVVARQPVYTTSCRRTAATICLRPCKLTIFSYLFARWHLFRYVGYLRH